MGSTASYATVPCVPVGSSDVSVSHGDESVESPWDDPECAAAPAERGAHFGRYMKTHLLGVGSFSKVFCVRDAESGGVFALKEVQRSAFAQVSGGGASLLMEQAVLARAEHPFLIRLHGWFCTRDRVAYVLEHAAGGALSEHLRRARRFAPDQVRLYAAEIALALEYLHARGVVYRDLKPENVLLTAAGHVKLADFGLAKIASPDATSCGNTFCGTPEYMAPEVIEGHRYGRAVDWWALGVLVYELTAGRSPFRARDVAEVLEKVRSARIDAPPSLSPAARDFVLRLLVRDGCVRLGSGTRGAQCVKSHAFFHGLDWGKVYRCEYSPRYVPITGGAASARDAPAGSPEVYSCTHSGSDFERDLLAFRATPEVWSGAEAWPGLRSSPKSVLPLSENSSEVMSDKFISLTTPSPDSSAPLNFTESTTYDLLSSSSLASSDNLSSMS